MKTIEELGISPTPWRFSSGRSPAVLCGTGGPRGFVFPVVCQLTKESNMKPMKMRNADARIMAAAPEMYEALEEAQRETCFKCHGSEVPRGDEDCDQCIVAGWVEALAKAGGAE